MSNSPALWQLWRDDPDDGPAPMNARGEAEEARRVRSSARCLIISGTLFA
jgi:hypothetical protein